MSGAWIGLLVAAVTLASIGLAFAGIVMTVAACNLAWLLLGLPLAAVIALASF
jgi:hypothetical protein